MSSKEMPSPWSPETEYEIVRSKTPRSVDGYKKGEPKYLKCAHCGARVLITREPTPGIDEINHDLVEGDRCPQWRARSEYWRETHPQAVERIMDSLHQ